MLQRRWLLSLLSKLSKVMLVLAEAAGAGRWFPVQQLHSAETGHGTKARAETAVSTEHEQCQSF